MFSLLNHPRPGRVLTVHQIALPLSFALGFALHFDLIGLWAGPALGLAIVSAFEGIYIYRTSYQKASEEAARRNAAG